MQPKEFRIFLSLLILFSIISLVDILTLPKSPHNAWFLGFSRERFTMIAIFIIINSGLIFLFLHFRKNPTQEEKALRCITENLQLNWLYFSILFLTLCAIYLSLGFATSGIYSDLHLKEALVRRLWPVFYWCGGCSLATLFLLLFFKRRSIAETLHASIHTWIFGGYFLAYLLFFILPTFLNSEDIMKPVMPMHVYHTIGLDLRIYYMRYSLEGILEGNYLPYVYYTPFVIVFFAPFLLMSGKVAYGFLTMINLSCYLVIVFIFPIILFKNNKTRLITLALGFAGLLSYGFLYELERGQYNLIALTFVIMSIYIYHHYPKFHVIAYILIAMSIHLKLWPVVFVVMFIRDWGKWKRDLRGILYIGILSFALFFVLGLDIFLDFLTSALNTQNNLHWYGNHSIASFVQTKLGPINALEPYLGAINLLFYGICALCLFLGIRKAYLQKERGFNGYLFVICTVIACVVPTISHDYKLSILIGPVIIGLNTVANDFTRSKVWPPVILAGLVSFLYISIHFPNIEKPPFLKNNFPVLMIIMILFTILYIKRDKWLEISHDQPC